MVVAKLDQDLKALWGIPHGARSLRRTWENARERVGGRERSKMLYTWQVAMFIGFCGDMELAA